MTGTSELRALGWDAGWERAHTDHLDRGGGGTVPARVAAVDRGAVDLLGSETLRRATLGGGVLAALAADPSQGPCAGDWGEVREWPDGRVTLDGVLPRRTAFVRAVASGESRGQVLAANADAALVVVSLTVEPDLGRVERLVTLAWESGAQPVVVLTKADLVDDADLVAGDVAAAAPGVDVLVVSAVTGEGLGDLAALARPTRTLALLGQSGVGKSTLVNALAGRPVVDVGVVSLHGKGRHTTVRRELVPLPGGGLLLDTPGLRGVGVLDVDDGLAAAFPEIEELALGCRFGDCRHEGEPGCAVVAAVADGDLPLRRLESWRKLQREAAWVARRSDARLRSEERRRWAQVSKSLRRDGIVRP
jgi:ribosome biogenesis GTPase